MIITLPVKQSSSLFLSHTRQYIGTFSVEMGPSWKKDMGKTVKQQLARINTKVSASASSKKKKGRLHALTFSTTILGSI